MERWARRTFDEMAQLVGTNGVAWIRGIELHVADPGRPGWCNTVRDFEELRGAALSSRFRELDFRVGHRFTTLVVDPITYLTQLLKLFI